MCWECFCFVSEVMYPNDHSFLLPFRVELVATPIEFSLEHLAVLLKAASAGLPGSRIWLCH